MRVKNEKKSISEEPNTVFFGKCIRCESGKKYSQVVHRSFRVTMAALEPEIDGMPFDNSYVSVMVERAGCEYLLCTLHHGSIMQVNLNVIFGKGEKVTFYLRGKGTVHLTGYHEHKYDLDKISSEQPKKEKYKVTFPDEDEPSEEEESVDEVIRCNSGKKFKSKKKHSSDKRASVIEILEEEDSEDDSSEEVPTSHAKKGKVRKSKQGSSFRESIEKMAESDITSDEEVEEFLGSPQKKKGKNITPKKQAHNEFLKKQKKKVVTQEEDEDEESSEEDEESNEEIQGELDLGDITKAKKRLRDSFNLEPSSEDSDAEDSSDEITDRDSQKKANLPPQKRLRSEAIATKSSVVDEKSEVIDVEDDEREIVKSNENDELNSSIGRTPMPNKKKMQQAAFQAKSSEKKQKQLQQNKSETVAKKAADMSQNKRTEKLIKKLPGGIEIEDIKIGNGPDAKFGKIVHVHYVGKLANNKVFDCRDESQKPLSFKLGIGQVIKGWDIGIEGMKVGGKRKMKIPPSMGYGKKGMDDIPPNSTLFFVVELKAVN